MPFADSEKIDKSSNFIESEEEDTSNIDRMKQFSISMFYLSHIAPH